MKTMRGMGGRMVVIINNNWIDAGLGAVTRG